MDKKSKLLLIVFVILIIGSVSATFYKYFISLDYLIQSEIPCDPRIESCFVWRCGADSEKCTGNPDEDIYFYKLISKKAYNYPDCDPNADENCVVKCQPGEQGCHEIVCDEANLAEGEECMAAEKYAEEFQNGDAVESEIEKEEDNQGINGSSFEIENEDEVN